MPTTDFERSLADLLQAFNHHQELRRRNAGLAELAASSHALFNARMAAYRSGPRT